MEQFNQKKVADQYAGKQWDPLLGGDSAAYHTHAVAGHFPHVMPKKSSPELYESVFGSPLATKFSKRLRKLRLLRIVWGRWLAMPALTCLP